MKRTIQTLGIFGALLAFCAVHPAAASDARWGIEVTGGSVQSASALGPDTSLGFGLGLEYRASRRLGVQLDILTSELDSEFDFFDLDLLVIESNLRMTPVLARLDVHLTPDRKVDLYLGPVLGYVRYGDIETGVRSDFLDESISVERVRTRNGFAWGGQIGMDIPMGSRGAFFTLKATYLEAEVETIEEIDDDGERSEIESGFDLDPFIVQAGFGYRF